MNSKQKSWWWVLTRPFAHDNYTTIGRTIYYPRGYPPTTEIIRHEAIHSFQQGQVGIFKYILLYLFALPILWNPWRFRWEMEAYVYGSKIEPEEAKKILRGKEYGWLIFHG